MGRRSSPGLLMAAASALLLSGCHLGPDYHPPEMAAPQAWRQPAPAGESAAAARPAC